MSVDADYLPPPTRLLHPQMTLSFPRQRPAFLPRHSAFRTRRRRRRRRDTRPVNSRLIIVLGEISEPAASEKTAFRRAKINDRIEDYGRERGSE